MVRPRKQCAQLVGYGTAESFVIVEHQGVAAVFGNIMPNTDSQRLDGITGLDPSDYLTQVAFQIVRWIGRKSLLNQEATVADYYQNPTPIRMRQ